MVLPTNSDAKLPLHAASTQHTGVAARRQQPLRRRLLRFVLAAVVSAAFVQYFRLFAHLLQTNDREDVTVPLRAQEYLDKCRLLSVKPGPPPDFHARTHSDRFVPGTPPTIITVSQGCRL